MPMNETFRPRLQPHWRCTQTGGGRLVVTPDGLRLVVAGATSRRYANAQIDDYTGLPRERFPWRAPLRMTVVARVGTPILGTAGFGFWNAPISPVGRVLPVLPAAIWFFYASPPADMPLAYGVPGYGWKVATIDATTRHALAWAPAAPFVLLANRLPGVYDRLWQRVQRALAVSEALIPPPDDTFRAYTLEWLTSGARFLIDGQVVHETDCAPRGPLGFVAWVDNQWLIATPRGRFGWGLHAVPGAQWMEVAGVRIEG
ncbi:MAG: hypothetical protein RMJ55_06675 [Roseiflexaceae bacterium]|nr:hypothetical protein [Roseiflexus sp.]MDW8213221.1 hypothetical protein [Roseiflexaceae bacterium]